MKGLVDMKRRQTRRENGEGKAYKDFAGFRECQEL
jgi:hypothetical protein